MAHTLYTFEYWVELNDGYKVASPLFTDDETEVTVQIKARNRATADRMMNAMFKMGNVCDYDGIMIDYEEVED